MSEIVIHVRDIIKYESESLLQTLPYGKFKLQFDDGQIKLVSRKKVYYSSFFWTLFRDYPDAKITPHHYVDHVLKGAPSNSDTHRALAEVVIRSVEETYPNRTYAEKERINEYIYVDCCERIHNAGVKHTRAYAGSIGLRDIIEVARHPEIREAVNNITADAASISAVYAVVDRVMHYDVSLMNNGLVKALHAKTVNFQQICQIVAARGFPTEYDGRIFRTPIRGNYLSGITDIYEFAADSCGARKALANADAPLQEAEYFARRLQILSMTVERLAPGDCGSTKYLMWTVKPPAFDANNHKTYPGDLEFMRGKYYVEEGSPRYKTITGDDPKLYGKTLKIRSGIFCMHPDPHAICEVCFGALSRNISRFDNLGHIASATMTRQTSQSVLGTKHLVASGIGAPIILTLSKKRFFTLTKNLIGYVLKPELKASNVKIVVSPREVLGLTDMSPLTDIDDINPERISYISAVDIVTNFRGVQGSMSIELQQGSRKGVLTKEFIVFLKDKYVNNDKWEFDDRNNFVFDLEGWDFEQAIFRLPQMEYSYSEHSQEIARKLESSMKNIADREKPDSPAATLQELFELVNSKLWVNLAALEVITYAAMIPSKNNYGLSRGAENPILGVAKSIIANRSLGAAMAYERHTELLINPKSFMPHNRPDSIFDVFVSPREVLADYPQPHGSHAV